MAAIDECHCDHRHCHRELQTFYYWDYSIDTNGVKSREEKARMITVSPRSYYLFLQVIDVGKCVGACPRACVAKSFSSKQFTNEDLQQVTLTVIEDCACFIPGVY